MEFVSPTGARERPIMVHRALLGSLERFFGVLIEHYAGAFPLWLAPVQAVLITITDGQVPYAEKVLAALREAGLRVETDFRNEKLGGKIREAEVQKVPYMLIIGGKEAEKGMVSVRSKKDGDLGSMTIEDFAKRVNGQVFEKR